MSDFSRLTMPPKNQPSKKTENKQKEKVIEDKTFGLKNKKGAKQQKFIQQVSQITKEEQEFNVIQFCFRHPLDRFRACMCLGYPLNSQFVYVVFLPTPHEHNFSFHFLDKSTESFRKNYFLTFKKISHLAAFVLFFVKKFGFLCFCIPCLYVKFRLRIIYVNNFVYEPSTSQNLLIINQQCWFGGADSNGHRRAIRLIILRAIWKFSESKIQIFA